MTQLTPEEVTARSFRQVFRGLDPGEVKEFLAAVAAAMEDLVAQRDRLAGRLGDFADRDLQSEFAAVGSEVTQVLEAARAAAEGMRDRATADAARWRSEAMAEAEHERRAAREDAEHLRSDAWVAAEDLIRQVQAEARRLTEAAERDSMSILGEAEREAHRLTASARREADDLTRAARMEAERLNAEAHARHDEIIEAARRQADASQERARALEQRRQELLTELETLRSSLARMEGEIDERRTRLGFSPVEAAPGEEPAPRVATEHNDWEPGETVRVVAKRRHPSARPAPTAEEVANDVRRLRQAPPEPAPIASPPAEPLAPAPSFEVDTAEPPTEPEVETVAGPETDELSDLFSRLRTGASPTAAPAEPAGAPSQVAATSRPQALGKATVSQTDPFELFQRLILPVTNRALRNLKRQLTEMQNLVLEEVRVSEGAWRPDVAEMEAELRPDLVVLLSESFGMGHSAAEELCGTALPRPPTPARDEAPPIAARLAAELVEVMEIAEESSRERSAAISRVFRAWRTDEADRRVNDLATSAYNQGLARSLEGSRFGYRLAVGGRGCVRCREAAETDPSPLPPIHLGCSCTLVPIET